MNKIKDHKVYRVLKIYSKLISGEIVNKKEFARIFQVNEKSVERDLQDIKSFFHDNEELIGTNTIIYKRDKKGYCLEKKENILGREALLALIKILIESRAFCKEEVDYLTQILLGQATLEQRSHIKEIVGNELLSYVPLQHNSLLLSKIWDLSECIRNNEITSIQYRRTDSTSVNRIVKPVAITFSEYYFYLIAYIDDFDSPTVFRMDRIHEYKKNNEKFYIPNKYRFEEGEFKKRVQFMYAGELTKIKFEFTGKSVEAILDKLPTAKIIRRSEGKFIIQAEVFGKGVIMWLLSQGKYIKVLEPLHIVKSIKELAEEIYSLYKE